MWHFPFYDNSHICSNYHCLREEICTALTMTFRMDQDQIYINPKPLSNFLCFISTNVCSISNFLSSTSPSSPVLRGWSGQGGRPSALPGRRRPKLMWAPSIWMRWISDDWSPEKGCRCRPDPASGVRPHRRWLRRCARLVGLVPHRHHCLTMSTYFFINTV